MAGFHLRVEGVNFASVLYDTNDLSVIRGASLLLSGLAETCRKAVLAERVPLIGTGPGGAAHAELRFETEADAMRALAAVRARLATGPEQHLSLVADVGASLAEAEAANRHAQFRTWTVPDAGSADARRQDALDGVRGAAPADRDPLKGWVSPATKARLDYGRRQRRRFLLDRLEGIAAAGAGSADDQHRLNRVLDRLCIAEGEPGHVRLCRSFADIVGAADEDREALRRHPSWIPESPRRKIAVIHLDGDGFGAARARLGGDAFAQAVKAKLDTILLRLVDDALAAEDRDFPGEPAWLRMEVLVWGGDDITLVVPAWRALAFMAAFHEGVGDWRLGGQKLGFTGGVIIASVKSPIRQLTRLAGEAVDRAKGAGARGAFTVDIFESAAPPESDLGGHRLRIFGVERPDRDFAFHGGSAGALLDRIREWRRHAGDDRFSRSRLIELATETARPDPTAPPATGRESDPPAGADPTTAPDWRERHVAAALDDAAARLGQDGIAPGLPSWRADGEVDPDAPERAMALTLQLLALLWDYAAEPPAEDGAAPEDAR